MNCYSNKIPKRYIAILILITLPLLFSLPVSGQMPDKIRIGLYFNDAAGEIFKASRYFSISGGSGIQAGILRNGQFSVIYEHATQDAVSFRKDTLYTFNGSRWTECTGTQNITGLPANQVYGPFHAQVGGPYPNLDSALQQAGLLKQSGIAAYPAFNDNWYIWAGFYTDQNAAMNDINTNLQPKLPGIQINIIQPSPQNIVMVSPANETLMIFASSSGYLQIRPRPGSNPNVLMLDGKRYRGELQLRRFSSSDMTVINILSVEEYLYGVIPCEIEAFSHIEALKAQAVAARTYTLTNIGKHSGLAFDLCSTSACQVYKGFDVETPNTNKAVDDTKGKCVTYNGSLAWVFYFSSSGGMTEDVANVWGSAVPYLKSVEDKYESGTSYNYNWKTEHNAASVRQAMLDLGCDLGEITGITISKQSIAGRAIEVTVKGTKNQRVFTKGSCRTFLNSLNSQLYTISTDADVCAGSGTAAGKVQLGGKKVMTAAGVTELKSFANGTARATMTLLGANGAKKTISAVPNKYIFTGKGWGHAVGMSQEGAKGMAKAGYTYDKILAHYFTGATVIQH